MDTGDTITLNVHVWRDRLAWAVMVKPRSGRRYIVARGNTEREAEPVHDTLGRALMDAAYEAYRATGE